jgi:hypothetical protein
MAKPVNKIPNASQDYRYPEKQKHVPDFTFFMVGHLKPFG